MRSTVIAMVMTIGATAAAADAAEDCPDGWFCEPSDEQVEPYEQPAEPQPPPNAQSTMPRSSAERPSLSVPIDDHRELLDSSDPLMQRRLGVFGRLQFAIAENGASPGTPLMGGGGVGFRAAPLSHLALDLALDAVYGRDYFDAKRFEGAISGAMVAFLNPGDYVQVFVNTGLFHSWASVDPKDAGSRTYRYWGAFMGLGAEYPLSRTYAFSLDLAGFIRGRADHGARAEPEFIDKKTGATSNASGGALLRGQITRYF